MIVNIIDLRMSYLLKVFRLAKENQIIHSCAMGCTGNKLHLKPDLALLSNHSSP